MCRKKVNTPWSIYRDFTAFLLFGLRVFTFDHLREFERRLIPELGLEVLPVDPGVFGVDGEAKGLGNGVKGEHQRLQLGAR